MGPQRPILVLSALAIALLLSVPTALAGVPAVTRATPTSARPSVAPEVTTPTPNADARIAAIERTLRADGVPMVDAHLPDLRAADPGRPGIVAPTYDQAPAPMGLADLGLRNVSGTVAASTLDTTSVKGVAAFTTAESVYMDGDSPDLFGVQMNAVATHVTLFDKSTYQFWAQDYIGYSPSSGALSFGDNLWNFSDPAFEMTANAVYAHGPDGVMVAPVYYYAVGPTFTVHYPFTVTFWLNSTVVGGRPTIYFNYSLASHTITRSGSFDYVEFNSARFPLLTPAKAAEFQANGTGVDPAGLPNDLELVLVGSGDGDTTSFVQLNAQFSLATWNATDKEYAAIPSAYDAGSDTGETSDGVGVFYNATAGGVAIPTASLLLGPSFLRGLWNLAPNPGFRTLTSDVTPANAFLLVTPGTAYEASVAQWAPTLAFGGAVAAVIAYPNGGNYYFEWMLSDYHPIHRSLDPAANSTGKATATMARSNALGIYTPIVAWGDGELAYVVSSGAGTPASPYVLEANEAHAIDPVFGAMNEYFFPVFPGILLVGTNATIHVTPPSLAMNYAPALAANLTADGLPATNHLQTTFWNVTNVTLEGATAITGWLSANIGFQPTGAVIFWASDGNLIAGNTFYDQGIALAFYGGTGNTVWGNTFLASSAPATNLSNVANSGNNTTGLWESEDGDLVYNNYFALPAPAYTPTFDPVSCENVCLPVTYVDRWNVSLAPASAGRTVLGENLTGSIIGTSYQGGNYWSNYGTPANPLGRLPYNDGGRISSGGDYHPLVRTAAYAVVFDERGLAAAVVWGIELAGVAYRTNLSELTVYSPNGTYNYTVLAPAGYTAAAGGNFTINGTGTAVSVDFTALVALTFFETGLVVGWTWNVSLAPLAANLTPAEEVNSSNATIVVELVPGAYSYTAGSVGYFAAPPAGTVTVGPAATAGPTTVFTLEAQLLLTETGLRHGTAWTVEITGGASPENFSSIAPAPLNLSIFELPPGAYAWTVTTPGYTVHPGGGSGTTGIPESYLLHFAPIAGTVRGTLAVSDADLYVNGSLVAVTDGSFSVSELAGVYEISVAAPGYEPYYNNVTVVAGETTTVPIVLTPIPAPAAKAPALGISTLGWAIIALLVVVAAVALLLAVRRRPPAPAAPVTPYSGAAAAPPPSAPAAPAPPPPWQEDPSDVAESPPRFPGGQ